MAEEVNYNISKSMQFKKISLTKVITRTSARFEPTSTPFLLPQVPGLPKGRGGWGRREAEVLFFSFTFVRSFFFSPPPSALPSKSLIPELTFTGVMHY